MSSFFLKPGENQQIEASSLLLISCICVILALFFLSNSGITFSEAAWS